MPRFLVTLNFLVSATAFAQTIITYAGGDNIFTSAGQQATVVQIGQPDGVAVDGQGNVYLSSKGLAMVLKVAPSGVVTVFAGNGLAGMETMQDPRSALRSPSRADLRSTMPGICISPIAARP